MTFQRYIKINQTKTNATTTKKFNHLNVERDEACMIQWKDLSRTKESFIKGHFMLMNPFVDYIAICFLSSNFLNSGSKNRLKMHKKNSRLKMHKETKIFELSNVVFKL